MSEVFLLLGAGLPVGFGFLITAAVQARRRQTRRHFFSVGRTVRDDDYDLPLLAGEPSPMNVHLTQEPAEPGHLDRVLLDHIRDEAAAAGKPAEFVDAAEMLLAPDATDVERTAALAYFLETGHARPRDGSPT